MWKCLLALPLVLSTGLPVSYHVGLKRTGCTATRIAYSVQNDGVNPDGSPMVVDTISVSNSYGRVTASINGVLFDSGLYAFSGAPLTISNIRLHDAAGNYVTFSGVYTHWTTLNTSGHNFYVQHWRLEQGSLVVP
jgi:hypothetical protein